MNRAPIITFCSDFGTREYYVGAVKGAILSACPEARIVDISHAIASHDLLEAAFTLASVYSSFPERTIHLAVVDPGVGSQRRSLLVVTEKHYFIAPDNGLLSLVFQREEVSRAISIDAQHYYRQPVSPTFHGRDIYAPVAGNLARGIPPERFGTPVDDFVRLSMPAARKSGDNQVEGIILHIDKFGNLITNLSPDNVARALGRAGEPAGFSVGEKQVSRHYSYYAQAQPGEVFSLIGSSGFYEIAAQKQPAARLLEARRGAKVVIQV